MESAIATIVTTFTKHSKGKDNLKSNGFKKMIQSSLNSVMNDTDNSSAINEMQRGLDENKDGVVSFKEYLTLIGYVANHMSETMKSNQAAS